MQNIKKTLLISIFLLSIFNIIGCGGGSSSVTSNDLNTTTIITLKDKLRDKTFYVVEDGASQSTLSKISFDSNLSKWTVVNYKDNFDTPINEPLDTNITVNADSLIISNLNLYWDQNQTDYINLILDSNSLVKLKLFSSKLQAQQYYDISLKDELKDQEFFAVENTRLKRELFKFSFNKDLNSLNLISYDSNFSDDNITGVSLGANIVVNDDNFTITDSNTSFRLNSKEKDYLNLVSTIDTLTTIKFYKSQTPALAYYNSFDLRKVFKNRTFYVVSSNVSQKSLIKVVFSDNLSQWTISVYDNNYSQAPIQEANASILVTEDILSDSGDSLKFKEQTSQYMQFKSLINSSNIYRFYNDKDLAQEYFDN